MFFPIFSPLIVPQKTTILAIQSILIGTGFRTTTSKAYSNPPIYGRVFWVDTF
jgi:hypothetical protein